MFSLDPPSPYDVAEPDPLAPCGCPDWDCSPATHDGVRYCEACGENLPPEWQAPYPPEPVEPDCAHERTQALVGDGPHEDIEVCVACRWVVL